MSLDYLFENPGDVLSLSLEHLEITIISLLVALLLAMPLGLLAARFQRLTLPILGILGAIYTIPSLALLAFLIPSLGLGRPPAIVTLAAYAQIFLVRNIVSGIKGIDPATLDAARGMGMTNGQVFRRVQFPLALPVILAGIRIATVTIISLATITAWINAGGLGTLLFNGIARNNPSLILAGAIAITGLALLADQCLRLIERLTPVARARRATTASGH